MVSSEKAFPHREVAGQHRHELNRRSFLKLISSMGGAAISSAALTACSSLFPGEEVATHPPRATDIATSDPTSTPPLPEPTQPPATPLETPMAQVALVRTDDRSGGIQAALDLLEQRQFAGKQVFLKPNFNSAHAAPGSTHNDTLQALVTRLQAEGADRITVGDRSGMGDTRAVMQDKGIFTMAGELGFETVVFDELPADGWVTFTMEGGSWSRGYPVAKPVLDADAAVQACCLKTHRFGGHFTLSLKNSVGVVAKYVPGDGYNYMSELHNSRAQRRMIAEINSAYWPDLILLDGMEAFVGGGPDRGRLVQPGVILAGRDRVAIDAVGVAILRHYGTTSEVERGSIFQQEQLARAAEIGIGVGGPEEIELLTPDPASAELAQQIREELFAG